MLIKNVPRRADLPFWHNLSFISSRHHCVCQRFVLAPSSDLTTDTISRPMSMSSRIENKARLWASGTSGTRAMSTGVLPPLPAISLGISGLIPFLAPPLYMIYNDWLFCADGEMMHLVYSASILSFLGGVRWGLTLSPTPHPAARPDWRNLTYSVTPSLLAWTGVLLHSPLGYVPITMGLLTAGIVDLVWKGYPFWFKALRLLLTCGALCSIALLFYIKFQEDRTLGAVQSIEGFKQKYQAWRNGL